MSKYIFTIMLILSMFSCNFASGSYPYAEQYKINVNETDLIALINEFKEKNPEYVVPIELGLIDGRNKNKQDHWYHVYFYDKSENTILNTWIRQDEKNTTIFAFHAVNYGLTLGNWKRINKDFDTQQNEYQKERFKNLFLKKIISFQKGAKIL